MELTPDINPRLVIELTDKTRTDLSWLVRVEQMNKTTLANRALQLYRNVVEHHLRGGKVAFEYPDGRVERLRLL